MCTAIPALELRLGLFSFFVSSSGREDDRVTARFTGCPDLDEEPFCNQVSMERYHQMQRKGGFTLLRRCLIIDPF